MSNGFKCYQNKISFHTAHIVRDTYCNNTHRTTSTFKGESVNTASPFLILNQGYTVKSKY